MNPQKAKIPTRSRMSFLHRFPHYSPRLVFSLGVIQIISGVAIVFLSLVLYRFDREKILSWSISLYFIDNYINETFRIAWIGCWVSISGVFTLLVSFRLYNNCNIYLFFVASLITVTITGTFAILISNNVIQHSVMSLANQDGYHNSIRSKQQAPADIHINHPFDESPSESNPVLVFNIFLLCFCAVSFVISILSFSIVLHHLCTCSVLNGKFPTDYHIYDTSTWSRKERIVQWVMQQSKLTELGDSNRPTIVLTDAQHDFQPNRKKLVAIQLSANNSTNLSPHET